jgi:hypothetical protein
MSTKNYQERCRAIHLLRSGSSPKQVATDLGRSLSWVYKWQARYAQGGWKVLHDQSRAPKHPARKIPEHVKRRIREVRSELETAAQTPGKLNYIGAVTIRRHLRQERVAPLPSISSIERELRAAGMVRPHQASEEPEVVYPRLRPTQPQQLVQVDIVPHYLPDGPCVSCFNAIDVVSRYPTGQALARKRSGDAAQFLLHVWRELGIPDYTQVDNESCFSGGFTQPYVLGRVLRLGLWVGTQLVYSPIRHPQSNGFVERFHQDYNRHVWDQYDLPDLAAVHHHAPSFFAAYRQSHHHSALEGYSPAERHLAYPRRALPNDLQFPKHLPLTVGKVHFIRRVDADRNICLLNVNWSVALAQPDQGVWATLEFALSRATLAVFDAAPGTAARRCLVRHPFWLSEPIQPLQECFRPPLPRQTLARNLIARSGRWISSML